METLFKEDLSKKIIEKCDSVKNRLWISSPYIGGHNSVMGILGSQFKTRNNLDLRLLVDITDISNCDYTTLNTLMEYDFDIRSLQGLHAKIYIFDNECVVTSANLTGRAFERKYEIGIFLNKDESNEAIIVFEKYFNKGNEIQKFSEREIRKQKRARSRKSDGKELGKDTDPFFEIPEPRINEFLLPENQRARNLRDFTDENKIWKISLGRRWVEEYVYDSCIRTNTIAIGWFNQNIRTWNYQRIYNELRRAYYGQNRTQNASSINNFVHAMNIGDLVLVYSDRTNIRAIGIVNSNYYFDRNLEDYAQRRGVTWLTHGELIDVYTLNNNKNLSEITLYELWEIDHNQIRELILSL